MESEVDLGNMAKRKKDTFSKYVGEKGDKDWDWNRNRCRKMKREVKRANSKV